MLDRTKNGIPLPPSLKKNLDDLAKELKIEPVV